MNKEFLFESIKNMFLEKKVNADHICILSKLENLENSLLEDLSTEKIDLYHKVDKEKDRLACLELDLLIKFVIDILV